MQTDFNLYGEEMFCWEILGWFNSSARDAEAAAIAENNIDGKLYNKLVPNLVKLRKEMAKTKENHDLYGSWHYDDEFVRQRKIWSRNEVAAKFPWMHLSS